MVSDKVHAEDLVSAIPEIAGIDGSVVLAYAPIPGVERRVSRLELVRWLQSAQLAVDPKSLPESIILARKMRRVSGDEIRRVVIDAAAARYEVDPARIRIEFQSFSEPLLPAEDLRFELGSALVRHAKPAMLSVRWSSPSGTNGVLSFRAVTRIRGSYAVARANLERGLEVSPGDFDMVDGDLPGDPKDYDVSADDLRGQQLTQSLKAGEALAKRFLRPALAVKRGDLIEIRVEAKALVLRAPARAEDSGSPGDVIRCRNLQSGTTVRAVIVDSRQAEVVSLP